MANASQFIGSKISLISKSEIRYEGILYSLDVVEATISLARVKSFGTEDRPTDRPVPPKDEIYEFIIFRGSDIKGIDVVEPPKRSPTLNDGLPNDPAILEVSASYHPSASKPQPTTSNVGPIPVQVQAAYGAAAVGTGKSYGADTFARLPSAALSSPIAKPTSVPPQQQANRPSLMTSASALTDKQTTSEVPSLRPSGRKEPFVSETTVSKPQLPSFVSTTPKIQPQVVTEKKSAKTEPSREQTQPHQKVIGEERPRGGRGGSGRGGANGGRGGRPQTFNYGREQPIDRRDEGDGIMQPKQPPPQVYPQHHHRGGRGGSDGGNYSNYSRGSSSTYRGNRGNGGGYRNNRTQGILRAPQSAKVTFDGDFDFDKANEELKLALENLKLHERAKENEMEKNGNPSHQNDSDEQENKEPQSCYKKDDFFDSISCEALERGKGASNRPDWRAERKLNAETFGVTGMRRGGPGFYRGGHSSGGRGFYGVGPGYGGYRGGGGGRGGHGGYGHLAPRGGGADYYNNYRRYNNSGSSNTGRRGRGGGNANIGNGEEGRVPGSF